MIHQQKKKLRTLSIAFFALALFFTCYGLFFQKGSSVAHSLIFSSLHPEQEAWIMTSLLIALLGLGCLYSSLKRDQG